MRENRLKRELGFWDSVAINVGVIIGVGIFRTPGTVAHFLDEPSLILLTWFLGGLIALVGGLCYAELSSVLPETGGTYVYLREAFGRLVGFLFGWVEFSILRAGSIAGVAYILTDYLLNFFPATYQKLLTILVIVLFTLINILGLHVGTRVQNILSLLKITSILAMVVAIFMLRGIPVLSQTSLKNLQAANFGGIGPALIPVLWTYGGWHQSTFMSGEFHDTQKALPRSLVTGIFIVTAVYLFINAAYLQVFTPEQMFESKAIAADIFMQLFGTIGKTLVTVAVLVSASGALNSTILTGGRIPFAVAHDYPRFSWFARVDPRFGTPLRSLLLNSLWASILVLWGNFEQLLYFFAFANWLFFALTGVSVFVLRSRSRDESTFSMVGYPWVPILFIISSLSLCVITVQSAPRESLFGFLLLLLGLPVYWIFRDRR